MTNTVVFLVLLVHAVGHLQGVFIALNTRDFGGWNAQSWLLKKQISKSYQRIICLVLFLSTFLIFLLAALSFRSIAMEHNLWVRLSFIGAVLSTASISLFPNGLAMLFNKVGAVFVNLLIFYTVLFSSRWLDQLL